MDNYKLEIFNADGELANTFEGESACLCYARQMTAKYIEGRKYKWVRRTQNYNGTIEVAFKFDNGGVYRFTIPN